MQFSSPGSTSSVLDKNIVMCMGVTNKMGFGLVIGFIDHSLYNHSVNCSNSQ
jgi:hypothetical protein